MRYDLVPQAKEELKKTLSLYGFPEALVEVEVVRDKVPCRVNVFVTIEAGEPLVNKNPAYIRNRTGYITSFS